MNYTWQLPSFLMGLGVLDDDKLQNIPGTLPLADVVSNSHNIPDSSNRDLSRLKHGKGIDHDIILVPQPSSSARDPLNWPRWRKELVFIILCVNFAILVAKAVMLLPGYVVIADDFHIPYNTVNSQRGWMFVVVAFCCYITNGLAVKFGKRPVLIGANVVMLSASVWAILSRNWASFLASEIVWSAGASPYTTLIYAIVTDLYFVHQRGVRFAILLAAFSLTNASAGIVSGFIIQNFGWRMTLKIGPYLSLYSNEAAILFGIGTLLSFLFLAETCYKRPDTLDFDPGASGAEKIEPSGIAYQEPEEEVERPWTLWDQLRLVRGIESDEKFLKVVFRPLPLLLFPQVILVLFSSGICQGWLYALSGIYPLIFGSSPYNMTPSQIGLTGIALLVSSLLGFVAGPLSDRICIFMARRNRGIYEAEFRLVGISITLLFALIGFGGLAFSLHNKLMWIAPVIFFNIIVVGYSFLAVAMSGYITDCFPGHVLDCFASLHFKTLFAFGFNFVIAKWYINEGPLEVIFIICGLCLFSLSLSIPLYIYGKRIRSWTARKTFLQKFLGIEEQ